MEEHDRSGFSTRQLVAVLSIAVLSGIIGWLLQQPITDFLSNQFCDKTLCSSPALVLLGWSAVAAPLIAYTALSAFAPTSKLQTWVIMLWPVVPMALTAAVKADNTPPSLAGIGLAISCSVVFLNVGWLLPRRAVKLRKPRAFFWATVLLQEAALALALLVPVV